MISTLKLCMRIIYIIYMGMHNMHSTSVLTTSANADNIQHIIYIRIIYLDNDTLKMLKASTFYLCYF